MLTWPLTTAIAGTAFVGMFCYGAFSPRSRLFAPVIYRGDPHDGKRIALTFDDGPHPEATAALLDVLAQRNVRAAFFVIGANAVRHPEVLRRIDAEGHVLGNHSFDHAYHGMFRFHRYWADQLARTDAAIAEAVGKRPTMFRPPMGFKQIFIGETARRRGYIQVTWTRRAFDGWSTSTQRILDRLVAPARPGEILTLHDGTDAHTHARRDLMRTVGAVGPLVDGLRQRGFELVRLDELIGVAPYRSDS
ncbi:MAG: polysaccharide deacetylase family protein [Phycisphaeraceae bacterium]